MAFTFIGISPNPIPLPSGLSLDSRRFAGYSTIPEGQRPRAPAKLKVKYTITDPEGRLKTEVTVLDPLPENCTVRDLQSLMHEHLSLSPRHPLVIRYHGEALELLGTGAKGQEHIDRPLAYYSIKDFSELGVVVKPMLSMVQARAIARPDGLVLRLRVMSHKLSTAIPIEEITPELKIKDIYLKIKDYVAQKPIYLIGGPEPPLPIGARPEVDFTLAEPLWDGTLVIKAKVGDQLMVPDGGSGGAKGKGGGNLKRISDGNMGTVVETDLWKFQINGPDERIPERWPVDPKAKVPEEPPKRWRRPTLQYGGVVLDDESLITSYGFLNNEILYLDFAAPWDPPPEKPGAAGGGGKKKKV